MLFSWTQFIWADQLIIEPEMGRTPILDAIKNAEQSIDLVMYGFTDDAILQALLRKQNKSLKIILERSPYRADKENLKIIKVFNDNDIKWHGAVPPYRLVHQKSLIIDDNKAIVMTFNFTRSTFKNERNFALVIDDAKRVHAIADIFAADWNHKSVANNPTDIILSPDDSRDKFTALIKQAKNSIQIYAQTLNDYKLVGALAKTARKGVKIDVLTSASMRGKQLDYLTRAGVNIHQSNGLYIHAKAMVIDNQIAIIGSTNLTRASLEDNRELSVVTRDPTVIRQLSETFEHDLQAANNRVSYHHYQNNLPNQRAVMRAMKHVVKWAKTFSA